MANLGADIPEKNQVLEVSKPFGGSGSGSKTDPDIMAVQGPVLKDFCLRVRFSGTWTDPGTTLTNKQTDRRTWQLLDQLGPEGRVGENEGSACLQRSKNTS